MTTRIIKKQDVVMQGTVRINKSIISAKPHNPGKNSAPADENITANIVEKTNDFLVIEVCCPCGKKTFLKCQYAKN